MAKSNKINWSASSQTTCTCAGQNDQDVDWKSEIEPIEPRKTEVEEDARQEEIKT